MNPWAHGSKRPARSVGGALRGWRVAAVGLLWGVLAAGSAAPQMNAAIADVRQAVTPRVTQAHLAGIERRIRLADDRQLVLAANGRQLELTDVSGRHSLRSYRVMPVRMGASVALLPSGRVLIWGGADAQGRIQRGGLWFDPQMRTLEAADDLLLSPRAGHTATVLMDGRVLFAGGLPAPRSSELWDERTGRAVALAGFLDDGRVDQRAELQADGRVRFRGGTNGAGVAAAKDLVFDPIAGRVSVPKRPLATPGMTHGLAASSPAEGAIGVLPDARLSLRFAQPMPGRTLTPATVTLVGPEGAVPLQVAPAESGRLAFVQPRRALFPDTRYSLMVAGAREAATDWRMPLVVLDFRTAAFDAQGRPSDAATTRPAVAGTPERVETGVRADAQCPPHRQGAYRLCRRHSALRD